MVRSKVLLVEDNPRICAQLRSLLESMGLEVFTATTGIEGLLTYNRELPQLVIMEQFLPFLSGEELIHRLRTQVTSAQLPVIVITSSRFGALTASARSQVNAICQKPLRAQQFREAVTQTLQQTMHTCHPSPLPGLREPEQFYLAWGELSQTPFSTLMFHLKQQKSTGVLTLTLPQGERRFSFRQGELVYAESLIHGEMFTQFLFKRLPNRLDETALENTVAGTGGRAALQHEAILRAGLLTEQEVNPLYQLYLENVVIRSLFLMQGPYQFLDDSAYVNRTAVAPINVLLLLFEGVRRYYMPQKLLQALSPYHLYRCHISPLYEEQIASLIPRFQNVSFAPHRLSGRTVQQLLREFTPNTSLSAQLLQTLSLARLLVFQGPDGTMGQPHLSGAMEGPVVIEGALSPLGGQFEPPVTTPHSAMGGYEQSGQYVPPERVTGLNPTLRRPSSGQQPVPVGLQRPSSSDQEPVPVGLQGYIPGLDQTGNFTDVHSGDEPTIRQVKHSQESTVVGIDREAHLGALAGESPLSQGLPRQPYSKLATAAATAPALKVTTVDPGGLVTSIHPLVSSQVRGSVPPNYADTYVNPMRSSLTSVPPVSPSVNGGGQFGAQGLGQEIPTEPTGSSMPPNLVPPTNEPAVIQGRLTPPGGMSMGNQSFQANSTGTTGSSIPLVSPMEPLISPMAPLVPSGARDESTMVDRRSSLAAQVEPLIAPSSEDGNGGFSPLISPGAAAAAHTQEEAKKDDPALSWVAQLDIDFLRVQSDNFFLALNISESATTEDIQKAYRLMSNRYNPERVREALPESRTKAGDILRRISQAFSALTEPQARHHFELQLNEHKRQIRNKLIYSLEQYRQGEVCLEQKKYNDAETFFKYAMEANPREPVYFLRLGWSIYQQKSPSPLKRLLARSYIERAVKMSPIFEDAYFYLGIIRKEDGAYEEAASLFQRILLLNPGHMEAYQLLGEVSQYT